MTIEQPVYGEKNMQQIPVIDLSAARSGGLASRQAVAREIDATCREIGFFTITGHGVPIATMDQLRSKAHAFFAHKDSRRWRLRVPARRRPTSRSSIISAGKAGQTSRTIPGSKAGIISYRICGRSSRRALPMRLKLTMRKWRNWPR